MGESGSWEMKQAWRRCDVIRDLGGGSGLGRGVLGL